jgi:hypothetical protein
VRLKRLQWRLQILTELCDARDIVLHAFMHRDLIKQLGCNALPHDLQKICTLYLTIFDPTVLLP